MKLVRLCVYVMSALSLSCSLLVSHSCCCCCCWWWWNIRVTSVKSWGWQASSSVFIVVVCWLLVITTSQHTSRQLHTDYLTPPSPRCKCTRVTPCPSPTLDLAFRHLVLPLNVTTPTADCQTIDTSVACNLIGRKPSRDFAYFFTRIQTLSPLLSTEPRSTQIDNCSTVRPDSLYVADIFSM